MFDVSILSPAEVIFEGKAKSVIVPGEEGVFEVQSFHKRTLSRLISGIIFVDETPIRIKRGAIKVNQNQVTVIVEEL